jgi:ribose-phosphate pyrophosphokinase
MPIFINNEEIVKSVFAGGECHVKIPSINIGDEVLIRANLFSSDDVMCLLLTVDAVRHINPHVKIKLTIPYFPYSRQDRVCCVGEALSVKVMAGLINNLNCYNITIFDPHSMVTMALLNNCQVISLADIVSKSELAKIICEKNLTILSPDAGAESKVREVAKRLTSKGNSINMLFARKSRNALTGNIISTEVFGDVKGKNIIILDDICDLGSTFISLTTQLRKKGANEIYLYITHGIFSKGLSNLKAEFNHVYCYHTMLDSKDVDEKFLTILEKGNFYK